MKKSAPFPDVPNANLHTAPLSSNPMVQIVLSQLTVSLRNLVDPDTKNEEKSQDDPDQAFKKKIRKHYQELQQVLTHLFNDQKENISAPLEAIEKWLEDSNVSQIREVLTIILGLANQLKDHEFLETVIDIAKEIYSKPHLLSPIPVLLGPLFLIFSNRNSNAHQWIYFIYVANELRSLGFSLTQRITGVNLYAKLFELAIPILSLIAVVPELRGYAFRHAMPLTLRIPGAVRQLALTAAKRAPLLTLGEYPAKAGVVGKTTAAIYFMCLTSLINRISVRTVQDISLATSLILPTPVRTFFQNANTLHILTESIIFIGSTKIAANNTQDLIIRYQRIANQITLRSTVTSGWKLYQQVNPSAISLYNHAADAIRHPFRLTYNFYLLLTGTQLMRNLLAGPNPIPSAIVQVVIDAVPYAFYLGPLFPEQLQRVAKNLPIGWVSRSVPLLKSAAHAISQSPLALPADPNNPNRRTEIIQTSALTLLSFAGHRLVSSAPSLLAYLAITSAAANLPESNTVTAAIYQAITHWASRSVGQMGNLIPAVTQLIISLGLQRAAATVAREHAINYVATASEYLSASYAQAKTAYRYATPIISEQTLRLWARWDKYYNFDLGQYYQNLAQDLLDQQRSQEAISFYNKAIETYALVPPHTQAEIEKNNIDNLEQLLRPSAGLPKTIQRYLHALHNSHVCKALLTLAAQPLTPENNQRIQSLLNGNTIILNQFSLAEQYRQMGFYREAIAIYTKIHADNSKVEKPTKQSIATLKLNDINTIKKLKLDKIDTIQKLITQYHKLPPAILQLPPAVDAYLTARATMLVCEMAIKVARLPNYNSNKAELKIKHRDLLKQLSRKPKVLLDPFRLAECYKQMKFFTDAIRAYDLVQEPSDAEIKSIESSHFSLPGDDAPIRKRIKSILNSNVQLMPTDAHLVTSIVNKLTDASGIPIANAIVDIDSQLTDQIKIHKKAIANIIKSKYTIDELVKNYLKLPYYNDPNFNNDPNAYVDLPQFTPTIDKYLRAQVFKAACQTVVATQKLPACKTPADYADVEQLLVEARKGLDRFITYPTRITEADFYRFVEWQVTHARWQIVSGRDPNRGLKELSYLLSAKANNQEQNGPIPVLGELSPNDIYYPGSLYRKESLKHVVVPAIVSTMNMVLTQLEKDCQISTIGIESLTAKIDSCQQLVQKLEQLCKNAMPAIFDEKTTKEITETLSTSNKKIQNAISSLEIRLMHTICTHDKNNSTALQLFIQNNNLIATNESPAWKIAHNQATNYKSQKNWALAHVYYRASIFLIEKEYGKIPEKPNALTVGNADYTKSYYRAHLHCATTLEHVADGKQEPLLQLTMLTQAANYYQKVQNVAGCITGSDNKDSPLYTRELSDLVSQPLNQLNQKIQTLQKQLGINNIDEKEHPVTYLPLGFKP